MLVSESKEGVANPGARERIQSVVEKARDLPEVTRGVSPLEAPNADSGDGEVSYATLWRLADEAGGQGLTVEAGGRSSLRTRSRCPASPKS